MEKNLLMLPVEREEKVTIFKYIQSILVSFKKSCLQGKLLYQSLTDIVEEKYPTLAPSNLPVLPKAGETEKHL